MSDVYVVTSGEYSDYSLDAIFTTEELAEQFIERRKRLDEYGYDGSVELMPVHDSLAEPYTSHNLFAVMAPDGSLSEIHHESTVIDTIVTPDVEPNEHTWVNAESVGLRVNFRRSEDEAMKALHDLAARVRAERAGIA